ncbi:hypothetical protein E1265_29280 [Streptomyces sp. 8K308]|nr:hypothetical protein E1265_29280 [Streptomyces sp. 8K308]
MDVAEHLMRAEYLEGRNRAGERVVKTWHVVRDGGVEAMCGRTLEADAEVRSDEEWGQPPEKACHTCGALYLREVPYRA